MNENTFSKEQLINSERFANYRDLLDALLESGSYTIEQTDDILNQYLKGKVI